MDDTPSDSAPPSEPEPSPFDHIVDDSEAADEAREWVLRRFVEGVEADAILARLLENGWETDEAEGIVEQARRATLHLRGGITREQVAQVAEARYRQSISVASRFAVGGLPLVAFYFLMNQLSLLAMRWPKANKARQNPNPPTSAERE